MLDQLQQRPDSNGMIPPVVPLQLAQKIGRIIRLVQVLAPKCLKLGPTWLHAGFDSMEVLSYDFY